MKLFEIKVNYERQTGEDNPGLVRETYLVDCVNPSDAETILRDELKPFIGEGVSFNDLNAFAQKFSLDDLIARHGK